MKEDLKKLGPFDVVIDDDLPPDTIKLVSAAGPTVITARNVGSVELTEDTKRYAQGVANERMRCADIALDMWKGKSAKWAPWYKKVGQEIAREILMAEKVAAGEGTDQPGGVIEEPVEEEVYVIKIIGKGWLVDYPVMSALPPGRGLIVSYSVEKAMKILSRGLAMEKIKELESDGFKPVVYPLSVAREMEEL